MTTREDIASLVAEAKPSWLPISGHVVNITFSLDQRDTLLAALSPPDPTEDRVKSISAMLMRALRDVDDSWWQPADESEAARFIVALAKDIAAMPPQTGAITTSQRAEK